MPFSGDTVAAAYEGSMLVGEHTFGDSTLRTVPACMEEARAAGKYARLEESWGEKAAYIRKAADATRAATTADLQALACAIGVKEHGSSSSIPCPGRATAWSACRLPPTFSPG